MIRWCVQNFKSIWWDMLISQMKKHTKEIALKAIKVKSWRVCKTTKMYRGQFKVGFFHQRILFRSFVQSFKWFCKNFQTFKNSGGEKKVVKCYNHRSTLGTSLQCIITCSNFVLSTTGSDSVMCAKFQINLMRYADFPNEQIYKRDSLWRL